MVKEEKKHSPKPNTDGLKPNTLSNYHTKNGQNHWISYITIGAIENQIFGSIPRR